MNLHPLVWFACLPLFVALAKETCPARAFGLGYLSGAIFLIGSCYWFVSVMQGYGGLNPLLAVGVLALFTLVSSVFFGVFGCVVGWVARTSPGVALVLSPFLWVATELARTYLITGFPWNLLGYAVQASGLRQLACVTAVYGLSFLAAATSAGLAAIVVFPRKRALKIGFGFWVIALVVGNLVPRLPRFLYAPYRAYLVQPNAPLDEAKLIKWEPWNDPRELERLVAMALAPPSDYAKSCLARSESEKYLEQIPWNPPGAEPTPEGGPVDPCSTPPLIIWAENPAPFYFTRDQVFRTAMEKMARQVRAYMVFNTVTFAGQDNSRPQNSAIVLDPGGRLLEQYDKIHLVPFGEYVPAWAFPGKIGKITSEVGNYVPGSSYRVAQAPQGSIAVFICYEAIFPQLVRRLTLAGAGVLVNISNDAWFGDSAAAYQHLEMARLRAIENRRYLLRATNDGITTVIDPYGRVMDRLPRHCAQVLSAEFNYRGERTFYTAHGDVFAWFCVAATAALLVAVALSARARLKAGTKGLKSVA